MNSRTWSVLVAILAIYGCAGKSSTVEPPAALEPIQTSLSVNRVWSYSLAGPGSVRVGLAPVFSGLNVIAAGYDGRVVSLGMENGRLNWEARLGLQLAGGPGAGDGLVVVGATDGTVIALDLDNGTVRWRKQVSSVVLGPAAISRGIVSVRSNDGAMFGLDASNGDILWRLDQPVPSLTLRGTSGVVAIGELMVAGFDNGRVLGVLARDGQIVWESQLAMPSGRTEVERMVDVATTPRVLGRDVYAVSYRGQLAAIGGDSGFMIWAREFSSVAGLGVDGRGVWATDSESEVWGLERSNGSQIWRQSGLRMRSVTAPASGETWVAAGDFEGWLHFMDRDSGAFVARIRADRRAITAAPISFGQYLIVQGTSGNVTAYKVGE